MITINTNVNNLKLQRNLNSVNSTMQNALSRISTGYKINNASDDAAGLVISKALETQTRGLNIANNNAQMATNLLNTADGALNQMSELTMRIRDLATQSSNGVYSNTERKALDLEAKQLNKSITQLISGTKFNEYNIFAPPPVKSKGTTTEAEAIAQGYEIVKTVEELNIVLHAPDALSNSNKKVMLFADINLDDLGLDATGSNWEAVGHKGNYFNGTFDGNGHIIKNLKINAAKEYQGFFGAASGMTIQNVGLESADVENMENYTGILVGVIVGSDNPSAKVDNCYSTGVAEGKNYTGGLVGGAHGGVNGVKILNSYSTANVAGATSVGGFAGDAYTNMEIKDCYSTGNVTGYSRVGGFAGQVGSAALYPGKILNSYSTGNVYSVAGSPATASFGGFMGLIASKNSAIENCFSLGQNYATVGRRGGFLGTNDTTYPLPLEKSKNNYCVAQTSGINAQGYGRMLPEITQKPLADFTNEFQKTVLSTNNVVNNWDFITTPPKLIKTNVPPKGLNPVVFQIGTDGSELSSISVNITFDAYSIAVNFTSPETSRTTMQQCDNLLKQINTKRGEIGANTNIISSIVDGNTITNENLTASQSRIKDADIARESASMVKNQILESATSSLLSQSSNINGQLALQLLSGIGGR